MPYQDIVWRCALVTSQDGFKHLPRKGQILFQNASLTEDWG
ncbi:hypothetical protein DFO74_1271 [Chromohalobacter israelensis]|nr:hypothetical protein DFO74_1271 [Chromohalobacter salexigens]